MGEVISALGIDPGRITRKTGQYESQQTSREVELRIANHPVTSHQSQGRTRAPSEFGIAPAVTVGLYLRTDNS
jgi:hypothetical protein